MGVDNRENMANDCGCGNRTILDAETEGMQDLKR